MTTYDALLRRLKEAKFQCIDGNMEETAVDFDDAIFAIDQLQRRTSELEAARIAYASEFAPNADGEPDVGNIHANIRKLKSDAAYWRARAKDAEDYIDDKGF